MSPIRSIDGWREQVRVARHARRYLLTDQPSASFATVKPKHVIVFAGPTASGKSAAALALALEHPVTVINADAQQVYRDLAVLTARPRPEEIGAVPHRLYGVLDAADACTAGRWRALALTEIRAADDAGRLPVLVGGTGLYLK